jgi:hypothetical protein
MILITNSGFQFFQALNALTALKVLVGVEGTKPTPTVYQPD